MSPSLYFLRRNSNGKDEKRPAGDHPEQLIVGLNWGNDVSLIEH